jgi:Fe-S-cluster containining protein
VLPVARELTDATVAIAVGAAKREGRTVSCRAGCGACCRQLVPIAPVEARRLAALVEELPEPRRSQVRERFAVAARRLSSAGLLARLEAAPRDAAERRVLGLAYFAQRIACPFLDEESCSIYAERPLACREYLVTSPPERCAEPTAATVRTVELPARISNALARLEPRSGYVPLVLAPSWAAAHPPAAPRPGTDILRSFIASLAPQR